MQEGITYAKYDVILPSNYQVGDIGDLVIHIVYLYRYVNLPASITLTEDQKVQYEDVKYIVSPYHIVDHETTYKFARILYFCTYSVMLTLTDPEKEEKLSSAKEVLTLTPSPNTESLESTTTLLLSLPKLKKLSKCHIGVTSESPKTTKS